MSAAIQSAQSRLLEFKSRRGAIHEINVHKISASFVSIHQVLRPFSRPARQSWAATLRLQRSGPRMKEYTEKRVEGVRDEDEHIGGTVPTREKERLCVQYACEVEHVRGRVQQSLFSIDVAPRLRQRRSGRRRRRRRRPTTSTTAASTSLRWW